MTNLRLQKAEVPTGQKPRLEKGPELPDPTENLSKSAREIQEREEETGRVKEKPLSSGQKLELKSYSSKFPNLRNSKENIMSTNGKKPE